MYDMLSTGSKLRFDTRQTSMMSVLYERHMFLFYMTCVHETSKNLEETEGERQVIKIVKCLQRNCILESWS